MMATSKRELMVTIKRRKLAFFGHLQRAPFVTSQIRIPKTDHGGQIHMKTMMMMSLANQFVTHLNISCQILPKREPQVSLFGVFDA